MRVLVTGGAGFIGSHFAKRLQAAGDDVRVLDKLTYSGNPANLDGTGIELVAGDICDAAAVAEAAEGCDAIVNFAAETHVDRSILGPTEFGRTTFFGTQVLLDCARAAADPASCMCLDRRGLRRPRRRRLGGRGRTRSSPSSPYSAAKAGGDLQVLGSIADVRRRRTRSPAAPTPTGRYQYPEKLMPLMTTNALEGSRFRSTGMAARCATGSSSRTIAPGSSSSCGTAEPARSYNVGGDDERENGEITSRILELTGAELRSSATSKTAPDTIAATRSTRPSARGARMVPQKPLRGGFRRHRRLVRGQPHWWEPIKQSGGYREYYDNSTRPASPAPSPRSSARPPSAAC